MTSCKCTRRLALVLVQSVVAQQIFLAVVDLCAKGKDGKAATQCYMQQVGRRSCKQIGSRNPRVCAGEMLHRVLAHWMWASLGPPTQQSACHGPHRPAGPYFEDKVVGVGALAAVQLAERTLDKVAGRPGGICLERRLLRVHAFHLERDVRKG